MKMTEKKKKAFAGTELEGKTLGVIGLGAIGVLVANAATHLGMEVRALDHVSLNVRKGEIFSLTHRKRFSN